ncbi:MAG: ABC transporter permease [Acidobacteria bacterium]|nr:ABC transporter permease [Acidobacteriota bacterium]MBI3423478.1 ABC transporter permease [Acidobacteriota bacterium]
MSKFINKHQREFSVAVAYLALLLLVAFVAPNFFSAANLRDLALGNAAVLIVAVGMTLVILAGQIDISVGSQFAVCSIAAGLLAKAGWPMPLVVVALVLLGGLLGATNGALVAWARIPAIVVTLATMVAWRDGLRWLTEGAWVQGLPASFQWFGLGQTAGQWLIVSGALAVWALGAWCLGQVAAGRAVYAVGCDEEAARLAGIQPPRVTFGVFALLGALTGLAALLNAIRFSDIQSNAGVGLEMKAIAAVVVGGTAITGGRGTLAGTLVGVALLGTIGTALTFAGVNPFWEKAIQGAIILAAVFADAALAKWGHARTEAVTG